MPAQHQSLSHPWFPERCIHLLPPFKLEHVHQRSEAVLFTLLERERAESARPFSSHSRLPGHALAQVLLMPHGGDTCLCPPPGLAEIMPGWGRPLWLQRVPPLPLRPMGVPLPLPRASSQEPPPSKGRPWPLRGPCGHHACPSLPQRQPGLPAPCRIGCYIDREISWTRFFVSSGAEPKGSTF